MFKNKKGFVGMWSDVFKGFIAGFIGGAVVMLLVFFDIIPIYDMCGFCG